MVNKNKIEKKIPIWARTTKGFEWIAAAEAQYKLDVDYIRAEHRSLFFNCRSLREAYSLKCLDDAYFFLGSFKNVAHTRGTLKNIGDFISPLLRRMPLVFEERLPFRVTASFLGKKNYGRYELEEAIGEEISRKFNIEFQSSRNCIQENLAYMFRFHLNSDGSGFFGVKPACSPLHRRLWKMESIVGTFHPPAAAAAAFLADLEPGQIVVDPFVGAGTLLIEAAQQCDSLKLFGVDISQEAIEKARENVKMLAYL